MEIVNLICVAVSGVLLADCIDDFMEKGMIFRGYKYWLTVITKRKNILPFLYKPLGGCFTCFCVWSYFLMTSFYLFKNELWLFVFGIAITNTVRKIMSNYELL